MRRNSGAIEEPAKHSVHDSAADGPEAEIARLTRERDEALEQQAATSEVLNVINRSRFDLRQILQSIVDTATRLCHGESAVIFRLDDGVYRFAAGYCVDPEYLEIERATVIVPGQGTLIGRAAMNRQVVKIDDVLTDPLYAGKDEAKIGNFRSVIGVPLFRGDDVIGVLGLARNRVHPFSGREIELTTTFADQAVIAIENARLFDEVQAKTGELGEALQQQTATAEVLKAISRSAFDLESVLTTLTMSAKSLCGAASGVIFRREGNLYRYAASHMDVDPAYRAHEQQVAIQADRGTLIGRVALEKGAVQIADAWTDPEYEEKDEARLGNVRAMLGVPLMLSGEPIGAFALARREPMPFSQREVELVTTFADQAVIAIENARLFDEVQRRTRELSLSLEELRAAQDRLVQTEKLASLGQLTAGIAHEIKNPLNFVNNFSALSIELIEELEDIVNLGHFDGDARRQAEELTGLLKSNLEKVVQHGGRADSIVKNMLLHSRTGSGEHRSADINALVEESLNLAYHGARAERPGFNIVMQQNIDPDAGAAELYPQEITRVLLNLISNGIYAATKRKIDGDENFEATLTATTRDLGDQVEIRIRDNGTGIPPEVKDKIFNPFFTTKPAGEGTGLGLSMSHDIIVKQHGGKIEVDTKPSVFTEFIITLPRKVAARTHAGESN